MTSGSGAAEVASSRADATWATWTRVGRSRRASGVCDHRRHDGGARARAAAEELRGDPARGDLLALGAVHPTPAHHNPRGRQRHREDVRGLQDRRDCLVGRRLALVELDREDEAWLGQDGLADTLRPRLELCGADLARVHTLTEWRNSASAGAVTLKDLDVLGRAFQQVKPALVVIDPLQAFIGSDVHMGSANKTRPVLAALGELAEKHDTAILITRHLTKAQTAKVGYRGMGGVDFTAAVRSLPSPAATHRPESTASCT